MKPVNLLPEKHQPRAPSAAEARGGPIVLGVLAALLLLLVGYVLTTNQINSRRDQLVVAENQTRQAEAKATSLRSFGDFAQVKVQRVASVSALAQVRFDWERLMREVAHVLPKDVYLTNLEASVTPLETGTPAAGSAGAAGPELKLTGCARRQPDVAVTLVRLRRLHRALEAELTQSTREDQSTGAAGVAAPSVGAVAGQEGCSGYVFDATVAFEAIPSAPAPGGPGQIPAALGGGA